MSTTALKEQLKSVQRTYADLAQRVTDMQPIPAESTETQEKR